VYRQPVPPAKKGPRGCLVAAIVVGAVGLIGLVIIGVFAARVWNLFTPQERAQLEAELRESAVAGKGPAADALRDDGCFGVDVVDVATMPALKKSLTDAGPSDPLTEKVIVDCIPNVGTAETFTCERVAKTYAKTVGRAPGPFRVMVHKQHGTTASCSELRAPDGNPL
jgi:hypothetical protein